MSSTAVSRWEQPALPTPAPGRDVVDGWAVQVAAVAKLATYIAATDFVPRAYRGQDAAVAAAILAGREMGIGPMTALQHLHVVDGRPAMSAQLMRALVFAHGHSIRIIEANSARCVLAGTRAGSGSESPPVAWTMDDARRAGIAGKQNWARYPRQMLMARTTAELCRAVFPDVIGGMAYVVEEIEDLPPEDGWQTPAPTRTVRRARKEITDTPGPDSGPASAGDTAERARDRGPTPPPSPPSPAVGPGEPPELPQDVGPTRRAATRGPQNDSAGVAVPAEPENGPVAAAEPPPLPGDPEPEPAPDSGHKPLSDAQRGELFRLLGELDRVTPRTERIRTVSALVGRRLESMNQLTRADATALIDVLVRCTETPEILAALVDEGWARLTGETPGTDTDEPYALWEDGNEDSP